MLNKTRRLRAAATTALAFASPDCEITRPQPKLPTNLSQLLVKIGAHSGSMLKRIKTQLPGAAAEGDARIAAAQVKRDRKAAVLVKRGKL